MKEEEEDKKILLDFSVNRQKDIYQDCHVGREPQEILGVKAGLQVGARIQ